MFGFLKLKAMHHNIIVIQVLEKVYNVILLASDLYKYKFEAWNMTLYTLGHIKDFSLFLDTLVGRCKTLDYGEFLKLKIHINVLKKKKECIDF